MSYWISAKSRVKGQFVGWEDQVDVGEIKGLGRNGEKIGVILPQTITMGTVTRRAVEPLWMTAANAKPTSIGSELKSKVQAPIGYSFVGADVDSEELWIASLLGDCQIGIHGATPLGFMTLQGQKSEGTDMHSTTAKILGISRDSAKVFNYARIYGAGTLFAENLLKQFDKTLSDQQVKEKARKLYKETKGVRISGKYIKTNNTFAGRESGFWTGGTESFTFNQLEEIAKRDKPRTPALNCEIPDGLSTKNLSSREDVYFVNIVS